MREYSKFIYLFIILIIVSSCDFEGEKNPKPPTSIFPLSAKFSIGTKIFRLPLVSIISTEKKSNALIVCRDSSGRVSDDYCSLSYEEIMRNTSMPTPVVALNINVMGYDIYREESVSSYKRMETELCPILPQAWAKISCPKFGSRPLGGGLRHISFVQMGHLSAVKSWIAGSKENTAELIQGLNLNIDAPQRGCGKDENGQPASLCAAVLPLGSDVLAVWIVTHKGGMKEVERDAAAIKTFTKYAISEVENYQAFKQGIEFLKN